MVIDGHREPKSDFQQKFCGNETHTSKGVFFWQKRKKNVYQNMAQTPRI